jgi:cytochrome c oxidase subunit 3|tara:strand:- start:1504 stop:2142 length:639 start_codon:yes stop_codon:yes gene_type:complete
MIKKEESIVQLLTQKPWDPNQAKLDNMHDGKTINLSIGKLGQRYIIIVSTILFCLFIVTYSDRMIYSDWQNMPEPMLLWFNSLVLLVSSIVFISVQIASNKKQFNKVKKGLLIVGGLSFVFLFGQLLVWQKMINLGYFMSSNPANAYFYLFTTLHGLHLIGGLIYWVITIKKVWISEEIVIRNAQHTVELCGIYWHFLLFVWLVLLGLMSFS